MKKFKRTSILIWSLIVPKHNSPQSDTFSRGPFILFSRKSCMWTTPGPSILFRVEDFDKTFLRLYMGSLTPLQAHQPGDSLGQRHLPCGLNYTLDPIFPTREKTDELHEHLTYSYAFLVEGEQGPCPRDHELQIWCASHRRQDDLVGRVPEVARH